MVSYLITTYGPLGVPLAIIGGLVWVLVRREGITNGRNGARITLADLRKDIHDLRDAIQPLAVKIAVNESEIRDIKERLRDCPLMERRA